PLRLHVIEGGKPSYMPPPTSSTPFGTTGQYSDPSKRRLCAAALVTQVHRTPTTMSSAPSAATRRARKARPIFMRCTLVRLRWRTIRLLGDSPVKPLGGQRMGPAHSSA